jgi:hypothetical protein
MSDQIAVANAPVSYGAFELTVGADPDVPSGTQVLDQVAAAGYAGIDLGLRRISFGGWLVVEQDILPRGDRLARAERFARAAAEQRHNRAFLAERGL